MLLLVAAAMAQGPSPKIINGADATEADFPATGGMIIDLRASVGNQDLGEFRLLGCSSTLIAPDVVALAAHCVDEETFGLGIGFGLFDVDVEIEGVYWSRAVDLSQYGAGDRSAPLPEDAVPAWDWARHEGFSAAGLSVGVTKNDDVALLFLETAVEDVEFMYLPTAQEGRFLEEGFPVTVVGWGQQQQVDPFQTPPEGSVGFKQVGQSYVAELGDSEFQVGRLESDVRKCHGDSGGPSFAEVGVDGGLRLVGITSHAYDDTDCRETGGVDTRVDYYLDWIDAEMRARCEDGSRSWCEEPGIPDASLIEEEEPTVVELEEKNRLFGCSSAGSSRSLGLLGLAAGLLMLGRRRRD